MMPHRAPAPAPYRRRVRSAGVGLVTAIFLLVVLAGLGAAAVTLFNAQQHSSSLDIEGARAYQAARAGIEWGIFQRRINNRCDARTSFAMPDSVMASFTVTVTCQAVPGLADDSGDTAERDRWRIVATACNQVVDGHCEATPTDNNADYVRRQVEVEL
jgi:MSHA biogenesis protein MshP